MSTQLSLLDLASVTSSPVSADGATPCASQAGATSGPSGPDLAHASHSAKPVSSKAGTMRGTFGLHGSGSSESADLKLFSESKSPQTSLSDHLLQKERKCRVCGIVKQYSEYYVNSKGSRPKTCKECLQRAERRRKRSNPDLISARHKQWRDAKRGHALVNVAKHRAKTKGISFDLDPMEIQLRIDAGLCEMTGIAFDLSTPRAWNAPSLDRADSTKGYTKDNVRVVLFALNVMANVWGPNRILEIASAIRTRRMNVSSQLQSSLTEALQRRLPSVGWMKPHVTLRERLTPWRRPYCHLVLWVRRTSEIDFSLLPTPAAQTQEGGMRIDGGSRSRRTWASLGLMPTGRAAKVAMVCWMMGFPPTWLSASPTASEMPSSLKSPPSLLLHTGNAEHDYLEYQNETPEKLSPDVEM